MREWHLQLLNVSLDCTARHDLSKVIQRFAADFRGYILADSKNATSMHVAVGLSGVLRALVVTGNGGERGDYRRRPRPTA